MGDWRVGAVRVELMCINDLFFLLLLYQPTQEQSSMNSIPTLTCSM